MGQARRRGTLLERQHNAIARQEVEAIAARDRNEAARRRRIEMPAFVTTNEALKHTVTALDRTWRYRGLGTVDPEPQEAPELVREIVTMMVTTMEGYVPPDYVKDSPVITIDDVQRFIDGNFRTNDWPWLSSAVAKLKDSPRMHYWR